MKKYTRIIGTITLAVGVDPRRLFGSFKYFPSFVAQMIQFLKKYRNSGNSFSFRWVPILSDRHMPSGIAKGHYFHLDLWAARKVYEANPPEHVDVASRVDGFVAHLLVSRSVKVIDVRPMVTKIEGLTFVQADIMTDNALELASPSVSCLHALEHFGLGRYGDPIDLDGWKRGLKNLSKMTTAGGQLYLGVPIGRKQVIEFNAQRIFHPETILNAARELDLELIEFSHIDDAGDFHSNSIINVDCDFGCGCYIFRKRSTL